MLTFPDLLSKISLGKLQHFLTFLWSSGNHLKYVLAYIKYVGYTLQAHIE